MRGAGRRCRCDRRVLAEPCRVAACVARPRRRARQSPAQVVARSGAPLTPASLRSAPPLPHCAGEGQGVRGAARLPCPSTQDCVGTGSIPGPDGPAGSGTPNPDRSDRGRPGGSVVSRPPSVKPVAQSNTPHHRLARARHPHLPRSRGRGGSAGKARLTRPVTHAWLLQQTAVGDPGRWATRGRTIPDRPHPFPCRGAARHARVSPCRGDACVARPRRQAQEPHTAAVRCPALLASANRGALALPP